MVTSPPWLHLSPTELQGNLPTTLAQGRRQVDVGVGGPVNGKCLKTTSGPTVMF